MKTIIAFLFIISTAVSAQGQPIRKVYGYVKNSFGQPVEHVKVTSQEKFSKTFTDPKGWYLLEVPRTDTLIYFIHDDYKTLTQRHTSASRFDVVIEPKRNKVVNVRVRENSEVQYDAMPLMIRGVVQKSVAAGANTGFMFLPAQNRNTENYSTIHENGFKNVRVNPLSTFSIDVEIGRAHV